ncbi:MAG: dihydroorotase [Raineya sp.]|jgi:dihydroorotase|nr:dihydroorotase [Raineya sp.]
MFLIQSATILDSQSPYHKQKKDILISNGKIEKIADHIEPQNSYQIIKSDSLHVSQGFVDMRCHVPDLGYEYKETLSSARNAAMKGGFTEICILPNMQPALDTKDSLAYILRDNFSHLVQIHPIAALTLKTKGEDLSEMIDLHQAGAIAFSDGLHPSQNADIVLKSLQYLQPLNALLIQRPEDTLLTRYGQMHEGITSTKLGLKGMPAIAEVLMIQRDLEILRYTKGKIHFSCLSAAKSVELIRQAKKDGLSVSCDVSAHQLFFTDDILEGFDTNYKVNPPFRLESDQEALWEGLKDGTIDCIVSDHQPQDIESKDLEFDLAAFGVIALETAFSAIITQNKTLSLEHLIEKLTYKPREILGIPFSPIQEGNNANISVWDNQKEWTYTEKEILSKSKNSPFVGVTLQGKVLAVFNKEKAQTYGTEKS